MRSSSVKSFSPALRSRQAGFTLVEILIALALITLLAVGITLSFDGSRSRAQSLISNMSELGAANIRLKNDVGCYVSAPAGLLSATAAGTSNYCGLTGSPTTWNGPYVGPFALAADNVSAELDKIAQGLYVSFSTSTGGSNPFTNPAGTNYYMTATGVPVGIVHQALQECNGVDNPNNGFANYKCDGTETSPTGTFMMLYDQTR